MVEITTEVIRELLDYDSGTGVFTWKERDRKWFKSDRDWRAWNVKFSGKTAGYVRLNDYIGITIFQKGHFAHRLVFIYMGINPYGKEVDHINRKTNDNRLENLRLTDSVTNRRNVAKRRSNMLPGVYSYQAKPHHRLRYAARIKAEGKQKHLGSFATELEAYEAYLKAAAKYGYHPNHGRVDIQ